MTITTAEPSLAPVDVAERWTSLHCHLLWKPEQVDAFLCATVAPLLDAVCGGDWFFIRYGEGGPHLRIRLRDASAATAATVIEELRAAIGADPHPVELTAPGGAVWLPHGTVRAAAYEREIDRYGGAPALAVAEDVFCRSAAVAVEALRGTVTGAQRLTVATDLVLGTLVALDLTDLDAARWLRRGAIAWRWHRDAATLAPPHVQGPALRAAAVQAPRVVARLATIRATEGGASVTGRWVAHVRAARRSLESDPALDRERWLQIWSSQLHMLLNRLGVVPDEERSLGWFVTAALLAPKGATDFFDDGTAAVDRRYLEASTFAASRMSWQQPRDVSRPAPQPRYNPYARPPVTLPAGELPAVSLADVLRARGCGRGDLGGVVTAAELGTLLWSSYAPSRPQHRPYPSAGAQYVARLRLIARAVDGLEPGQYEVDPVARRLLPLCPLPGDDELAETSMWFDREAHEAGRVEVATLPAMLGLYMEVTALRQRYGLRALRFALLEAGHLAQNLALVAAATGLSLGVIGGFYDDVAHEVFMLDGVDDVLAYLLPVGRVDK